MYYEKVGALANSVAQANVVLTKACDVLDGASGNSIASSLLYVPDFNAFGNTPAAGGLSGLFSGVREAGSTAAEHLGAVLDEDVIRLRDVIRSFKERDHEEADRINAMAGRQTLSVYSTHVHSTGSEEVRGPVWVRDDTPIDNATADDYVRAGQITKFQQLFNEHPGVVGGDFNVESDAGNRSAEAMQRFQEDGHRIDAGRLNDSNGGTSASHRHIDYVITAPGIVAQNPQRVDGGSSDHDGQRVDVTVPRW
ncbi:endonuclease/exonuclease/phosphatase family protein [Nonomuraea sp. NPDC048916]|uniref:endonuclease/exonuclease/phosphatase family protein n=1 Tax=Nonomuraea sp. NPDC048916 TaxID=3154232 RepID=UPI0033DDCDC9